MSEVRFCKSCLLYKEEALFYRSKNRLDGYRAKCIVCTKEENKLWRENNSSKFKAKCKEYRNKNPERMKFLITRWSLKHRDKLLASYKKYHDQNKEKGRLYAKEYINRNRPACLARCRARYARKLQATPRWANEFFIGEAYELAALRSKMLGFKWHVDHIVPLKSKIVCGLHVENNLQVIPASQNHSKGNRHWPDMPC